MVLFGFHRSKFQPGQQQPKLKSLLTKLFRSWRNASFRTKLSILLVSSAALPTILATHGILAVAEKSLAQNLQDSLQKDLANFEQQLYSIEDNYYEVAQGLQKSVELSGIDLSDRQVVALKQDFFNGLFAYPNTSKFEPSFCIFTDAQGQTVAQKIQVISAKNQSEILPISSSIPQKSIYQKISLPTGIDLSNLAIIKNALHYERSLSGAELIRSDLLQKLGLIEQSNIGVRPQQIQNLPVEKQPFPEGTYDIDSGRIGLVIAVVIPIKNNQRVVGTVIVGKLLNRDYQLVDSVKHTSKVSTATVFAADWRISTNVPSNNGKNRAIGTRVSREVASAVLNKGKKFLGSTNIIGQGYHTAYAPIFDHSQKLPTVAAKPVGIYYVGEPDTKIKHTLSVLGFAGYTISGGILCLAVLIVLPVADTFSKSLRRITDFAQRIGSGELGVRLHASDAEALAAKQHRSDEIGMLEYELNQMALRIEGNLEQVMTSELQIRQQAQQLEQTLQQLTLTQTQLIQNAKMLSLDQLVAGVAHEINNPVTFISGNLIYAENYINDLLNLLELYENYYPIPATEIVSQIATIDLGYLKCDLPGLLTSMKTGTVRIQTIVQSLRTFSRMDEAEYKLVDIHDGINSILELLQYRLKLNQQPIQVIKKYTQLPLVECYAGQLNQVFINILSNAIDALEENRLKVSHFQPTIHIYTEITQSHQISIRIADNGIGICEEIKGRVFDPFFTTKPVGKATGMGLSISYQIITEKHHGTLECTSISGEGAEFIITIPQELFQAKKLLH
jgi:signal transduction histidine kinase